MHCPLLRIRWTSPLLVLVVLIAAACSDTNNEQGQVECETIQVDSTSYCVYQKPITETGYDCPNMMNHPIGVGGGTVCAPDKELPEGHRERIEEKMNDGEDIDPGDTGPGSDSFADTADSGFSRPNACQDQNADLLDFLTGDVRAPIAGIPWKLVDTGGTSAPANFTGTWKGVTTLNSRVTFDCPPNANALGLNCTTDKALVIERTANGPARQLKIATALPIGNIDFPPMGTLVEVSYTDVADAGIGGPPEGPEFSLRLDQSGEFVLAIEYQVGEHSPLSIAETRGPIEIALPDAVDTDAPSDPATAFCVMRDDCRTWRAERLKVTGSNSTTMDPGTSATVQTAGGSVDVWHVATVSRAHNGVDGWPKRQCADLRWPQSTYAFARR